MAFHSIYVRLALLVAVASAADVTVVTSLGMIVGTTDKSYPTVADFLGVPYAQPPVGDMRWRSPLPALPWTGAKKCTTLPQRCIELPDVDSAPYHRTSEDCLFVNVYTPLTAINTTKLPVVVWLHGGGYNGGSPNKYKLAAFVSRSPNVVVVGVAFRLNVFGFLNSQALLARNGGSGNLGLQDQQLALKWVQEHIAAFGGDPNKITLDGQSSGGNSALNHMVMSGSKGLFHKVIIQSGANNLITDLAYADDLASQMLNYTNCAVSDVQCMLGLDATVLQNATMSSLRRTWWPVIDGVTLLGNPADLLSAGIYDNAVPVLLGSVRDEYALLINETVWPANVTSDQMDAKVPGYSLLSAIGQASYETVKLLYAPANYSYPADLLNHSQTWWTVMRMLTDDNMGHCVHRSTARKLVAGGTPKVYFYQFTKDPLQLTEHTDDVDYIFPNPASLDYTAPQVALYKTMIKYWTNFITVGDPNGAGLPYWGKFQPSQDTVLSLAPKPMGIANVTGFRKTACDFWDTEDYGFIRKYKANGTLYVPPPDTTTTTTTTETATTTTAEATTTATTTVATTLATTLATTTTTTTVATTLATTLATTTTTTIATTVVAGSSSASTTPAVAAAGTVPISASAAPSSPTTAAGSAREVPVSTSAAPSSPTTGSISTATAGAAEGSAREVLATTSKTLAVGTSQTPASELHHLRHHKPGPGLHHHVLAHEGPVPTTTNGTVTQWACWWSPWPWMCDLIL